MAQKISVEAALAAFRKRCGELSDENVLLHARISELEGELAQRPPAAQAPAEGEYESASMSSYLHDGVASGS